jgi:hypothetical protein
MRASLTRGLRAASRSMATLGLAAIFVTAGPLGAAPVDTVFQIDESASTMDITIEARGFTDSDEQSLTGTINATFDFGESDLSGDATVIVTGAAVSATAPFEFRLGLPRPLPGADVVASGIVADVSTPNPPATMTPLATGLIRYEFDASQFLISADEGTIVVTGFFNGTADLAETPVSGASPPGTIGTLTLTPGDVSGYFRRIDALLQLPIAISDIAEFGNPENPEEVMIDIDANVVAQATFWAALSGVPGDFSGDSHVDGADLAVWRAGYGMTGDADARDGDADGDHDVDGNDFLVWQRTLGTAPPGAAAAVPEPGAGALAVGSLAVAGRWRRGRRVGIAQESSQSLSR